MHSAYYIIISSTAVLVHCFPRAEVKKDEDAAVIDTKDPFRNDINNENDARADGISDAFKPFSNLLVPGEADKNTNGRNGPQLFMAVTHGIIVPSDTVLDAFVNIFKSLGNNPNFSEGMKNIMSSLSLGPKRK